MSNKLAQFADLAATSLAAIGLVTKSEIVKDSARALDVIAKIYETYAKGALHTISPADAEDEIRALMKTVTDLDHEVDEIVAARKRTT